MNEDTISRQAAIDALCKALYEYEDKTEKQFQESEDLDIFDWMVHRIFVQNMSVIDRKIILELPSVEKQEVQSNECEYWDNESNFCALYRSPKLHGQWIIKKDDTFPHMVCSECKKPFYGNIDDVWNYCPNCGAKMEHSFHVGQYVLYHNKDKYELDRIVSLKQNCAFICYNEGETAAATSYDSIYPIENEYTIKTTTLGGDRFTEEEDN